MALTFRDMWNDLQGSTPRLSAPDAQRIVNKAYARVRDYRLWSWLVPTGYIVTPTAITAGTITVTNLSQTIVADTQATTAINAAPLIPPFASQQLGIGYQIRLSSQQSGTPGPLYNVVSWDSAGNIGIDRPYIEASGSGLGYMSYKAYYQAPPADGTSQGNQDFLRYITVTNPAVGYTIRKRKLHYTQPQLNGIDPQRGATGDPYILAEYIDDPVTGTPVHEWYPHPIYLRSMTCLWQRRGLDLSDSVNPPLTMPSDLIMELAYMLACQWAIKNVGKFPELQNVNWVMIYGAHKQDFKERLIQCIKQDDEIRPLVAFQQGGVFDFPLGGQFLQNHDVSSLVGGLD